MAIAKFPHIKVNLIGADGNAFNLMGLVVRAMRHNGCSKDDIDAFTNDAMSYDYDHLLVVCMQTVTVE